MVTNKDPHEKPNGSCLPFSPSDARMPGSPQQESVSAISSALKRAAKIFTEEPAKAMGNIGRMNASLKGIST